MKKLSIRQSDNMKRLLDSILNDMLESGMGIVRISPLEMYRPIHKKISIRQSAHPWGYMKLTRPSGAYKFHGVVITRHAIPLNICRVARKGSRASEGITRGVSHGTGTRSARG